MLIARKKQINFLFLYVVHSPTNALFINLVKSSKLTLKCTIVSLLHVLVLMIIIRELHLYVTKVIFMLKHSVKLRRYIYLVLWQHAVERHVCCVQCRVRLLKTNATIWFNMSHVGAILLCILM